MAGVVVVVAVVAVVVVVDDDEAEGCTVVGAVNFAGTTPYLLATLVGLDLVVGFDDDDDDDGLVLRLLLLLLLLLFDDDFDLTRGITLPAVPKIGCVKNQNDRQVVDTSKSTFGNNEKSDEMNIIANVIRSQCIAIG
jgi:hypothetical protein